HGGHTRSDDDRLSTPPTPHRRERSRAAHCCSGACSGPSAQRMLRGHIHGPWHLPRLGRDAARVWPLRRISLLQEMETDSAVSRPTIFSCFSCAFFSRPITYDSQALLSGVSMNRERTAWLVSFLLLGIVALRNPLAAQRDSSYLFVRTLVDINHH